MNDLGPFLASSEWIDVHHPLVQAQAKQLAALLRTHGIPAALCYQRLSVGEHGAPYCLHGLNAVWLSGHGWYRIDARGNKPGVDARFAPPVEVLAFEVRGALEWDVQGWHAEPMDSVLQVLASCHDVQTLRANLPDVPRW